MKYVVTVNGEKYEVEVEKVDGRSASLSRKPAERGAKVKEETVRETVAAAAPAAVSTGGGANSVVSPMPGVILDIKVKEGDSVSEGQAVIILEAMKMENEIVSEFAGTVSAIRVKKGDTVDTDAVLVEIK
ncbi:biotin/lipoyl-containing protein [Fusobacterium sp.]|uniref:biotin/lipoyl-containing protein n=1 Tax=Fusobacterium sp. TaxID=68766 RepID=UPI002904A134|nr:biotin/lipoyl-containing protein [Fusobacterium sp.]MDU1910348.1 biotin/lipoyl-containing protein [Fusobacterium sp.]